MGIYKTLRELELEAEVETLKRENHGLRLAGNFSPPMAVAGFDITNPIEIAAGMKEIRLAESASVAIHTDHEGLHWYGVSKGQQDSFHIQEFVSKEHIWNNVTAIHTLDMLNESIQQHLFGALLKLGPSDAQQR